MRETEKRCVFACLRSIKNEMTMKKKLINYTFVVLAAVLAVSCSSSRKAARTPMIGGLTGTDYIEKVIELSPSWESLSGKVALSLSTSEGTSKVGSATIRLKRNESIQLSVAPLLGIEVARLEISPEGILALDRLNKRYVQVSFAEVNSWAHTDLSFAVLQSLFLNELFVLGKQQVNVADAGAFRVSLAGSRALLEAQEGGQLTYRFYTSTDNGWLEESHIRVSGTPYALQWKYDAFQMLKDRFFPKKMYVTIQGTGKPVGVGMEFSRLNVGGDWESRTKIPSRYQRVEIDELLKMLVNQ